MTRVLLLTGKGGVGKTSVAAATALRAAGRGLRTLVLSTDAAHSLGDVLDADVGATPTPVAPRLDAEQIDAQQRLEANWRQIQEYLIALLRWGGMTDVQAEELSVLPGLEEVFSLVDVQAHLASGAYDLVVVDCAPTAETLRLLSLPDALGWYLERVLPVERTVAKVVRPLLGRVTTMPLPRDSVLGAVEALYRRVERVRDVLQDGERSSVRLVVNAEKVVVAEARRTATALGLFGYAIDAVVVNRLLPDAVADPYFARWKALQAEHLATVRSAFAGTPVLTAPLFDGELVGAAALQRLADAVYGEADPAAVLHHDPPLRIVPEGDGWVLSVAVPFADRGAVDVLHRADELCVKVGSHTRNVLLPAALRRCEVVGAGLRDERLEVRFAARSAADPPHAAADEAVAGA